MGTRELLKLTLEEKKGLSIAAVFMMISAMMTAGYAYLVGPMVRVLFVDAPGAGVDTATLPFLEKLTLLLSRSSPGWIAGAIVITAGLKGVSTFVHTLLVAQSGQAILHRLRCAIFRDLLGLSPVSPHLKGGDLVARFTADVAEVESAVTRGILAYVRHIAEIVFLAGLAIALDYRLAALGMIAFPPAGFAIARIGRALRRRRRAVHAAVGEIGDAVEETVLGLPIIQAFGAEQASRGRFGGISDRIRAASVKAFAVRALGGPLNEILAASALALTLLFAADQIAEGRLLPETFISFFTALFMLYQPVKGLGQAHHAVASGEAAMARLELAGPGASDRPVPRSAGASRPPPELREAIRLSGVTCGYPGGPRILKNIHITIRRGDRIALVGPSGAGKTTFFNFLLGFVEAGSGSVFIDDTPATPADLARLFAPVRQEPFLFDDTIYNNVRLGRLDADEEAITAACRGAGVLSFSEALPNKLQTRVGPLGAALSVGQRQRVALARALLCDAPVLLLDEVTAALDGHTESAIVDALDSAFLDKTVVAITHRRTTAAWAERLVYLEDGAVAADGVAAALLETDARLAALFGTASPRD